MSYGKRPLGGLKQKWMAKVERSLADIGIREGETLAQDRDIWKYRFVLR